MASTAAISMAMPLTYAAQKKQQPPNADAFFRPLPVRSSSLNKMMTPTAARFQVKASSSVKEQAVAGLTAAALTASMLVPDAAQAVDGVSPSLKNFLLSIGAGGAVLTLIIGAIVAVSNFDPVKRS